MVTRIGINGFGRIGRLVLRANEGRNQEKVEVAAVNDLTDAETNAHLLKYDTSYGRYPGKVEANNGDLVVDGRSIKVFSERDPAQIPWSEMGVDMVIESTGIFTDADKAAGKRTLATLIGRKHAAEITVFLGVISQFILFFTTDPHGFILSSLNLPSLPLLLSFFILPVLKAHKQTQTAEKKARKYTLLFTSLTIATGVLYILGIFLSDKVQ